MQQNGLINEKTIAEHVSKKAGPNPYRGKAMHATRYYAETKDLFGENGEAFHERITGKLKQKVDFTIKNLVNECSAGITKPLQDELKVQLLQTPGALDRPGKKEKQHRP